MKKIFFLTLCLFFTFCTKTKAPSKITLGLELEDTKLSHLKTLIQSEQKFSKTLIEFIPFSCQEPEAYLSSQASPDIFEVDYFKINQLEFKPLILNQWVKNYTWINTYLYYLPGRHGDDFYFLPFRLQWLALFYNSDYLSTPLQNLDELQNFCQTHPGDLGLALGDDHQIVEFFLYLIWAFEGKEFDLTYEKTKSSLYFLSSLKTCISPLSVNYDTELLAKALETGEIKLAFGEPELALKLKGKNLLPKIKIAPLPENTPVAFTGTYLALNSGQSNPEQSARLAIFLSSPQFCEEVIKKELWLCPAGRWIKPEPENIFAEFVAEISRLKPAPYSISLSKLAQIYRKIIKELLFEGKPVELVCAHYQIELKEIKENF